MSKHKKNNEIGRTALVVLLALVILAAVIFGVILLANQRQDTKSKESAGQTAEDTLPIVTEPGTSDSNSPDAMIEIPFEIPGFTLLQEAQVGAIEGGLELLGVGRYTGEYFEDGSDDAVEDVYAIVVRNNGEDWVDFAAVTVGCSGRTLTFELSALPGTTSALVLEAGRQTWMAGDVCGAAHAVLTEDDAVHVYDFTDDFALYPSDGVINLQNISDKTFENEILLYYKNYEYGLFLGGVTYRARFDGLAPEAFGQSVQTHYSDARSMILYLSYGD